jgi:hypothetical protein
MSYCVKKLTETPNKAMVLYQSTWLVEETVRFNDLRILENAVVIAPEGKHVTLTVNGVGKPIAKGEYLGDVVLTVSDTYVMAPGGLMKFNEISRGIHAGIVVEDGKVAANKGVAAIVDGGEVTDSGADGIYIGTSEESFNGIVVDGESEFTVKNAKMDFEGFSDNDFLGVGCGVTCVGKSKVRIEDSEFNFSGVTRCAIHAGGDSEVYVKNCDITNLSPDSDWLGGFSWQVGFCGTNRLAQLTDNATVTYDNCRLKTNGWGICSIDGSDEGVKMLIKDSKMELTGPRAHGYGAFCIGDNEIVFDHSTVDVYGYPMLVMGMEGKGRPSIINGSVIRGRRFGAMVVADDNSIFTIADSTFDTGKANLVVKGSATIINITNTAMHAKNNVILQLMDPDESGMNVLAYFIPVGQVDTLMEDRDLAHASDTEDVILNIADCDLTGDFFNSTTNLRAYRNSTRGGMGYFHDTVIGVRASDSEGHWEAGNPRHGGDDLRGPKNLGLNLTNTRITGLITSASQAYREGLKVIREENRLEMSNITQAAAPTINNGVVLSLDEKSAWVVTGTSYITALNLAEGATVTAPAGKTLTMTVDGVETAIVPGSYAGKIVLTVA